MDSTDAAQLWGDEAELGDTSTVTQLPPRRAECPTHHLPALPFSTTFLPELLSSQPYRHDALRSTYNCKASFQPYPRGGPALPQGQPVPVPAPQLSSVVPSCTAEGSGTASFTSAVREMREN